MNGNTAGNSTRLPPLNFFRETVVFAQSCAVNVALRPRVQCCPPRLPNKTRIPGGSRGTPHIGFRETPPASPGDRCHLRMRCLSTEPRALGQESYAPEQCPRRELWRECVAKQRLSERQIEGHECRGSGQMTNGRLRCWSQSRLPIHQGAQLAVDIMVRSPLTSTGLARPGAATSDGVVLVRARADKEAKYFELLQGNRCLEMGGRCSTEATTFVDMLAAGRAREVPSVSRRSTRGAGGRGCWQCHVAVHLLILWSPRSGIRGGELKGRRLISLICSASSDK